MHCLTMRLMKPVTLQSLAKDNRVTRVKFLNILTDMCMTVVSFSVNYSVINSIAEIILYVSLVHSLHTFVATVLLPKWLTNVDRGMSFSLLAAELY